MSQAPPYRRIPYVLLVPLLAAGCSDLATGPSLTEPGTPMSVVEGGELRSLQATPSGHIRIGVIPSASSIIIGAEGPFVITDKATGAVLASGSDDEIVVDLLAAGEIRERAWLQVVCTGSAAIREDLLARGRAAGFETDTHDLGFCVRVMYGSIAPFPSDAAKAAFQAQLAAAGLPSTGFWWSRRVTVVGETQIQFAWDGDDILVGAPIVLTSDDGLVSIGSRTYRGVAEVWSNSGGTLAGINELPLEEYLYGVVPRELPPVPYGLAEAQKAQAVAARTYAVANMGKRSSDGYDLLPTQSDQVYGGYEDEHPVSSAAVDATAGVVAVHNGTLISTLYHSTSGGWTANSEDVYQNPFPYLRGVPDAQRGKALEHVPTLDVFMRHANPTNLRAEAAGDFEADWSRYHRWVVTWTPEEMVSILAGNLDEPITEVTAIEVVDRADQGRVRQIDFVTDVGTFSAHKDAIRWTLQYINNAGSQVSLRSTLFFIQPELSDAGEITGWKAYGGGWGHGVGMSQTGAVGMAEKGRTYQEILAHYYQGSTVEVR